LVQLVLERLGAKVVAIYLFGSAVSGEIMPDSDVDLGILLTEKMDSGALWNIAQEIASVLNRDVDLIDLLSASTVMQYEILTSGTRLYCGNADCCNSFDNQVMTAYLDLTEQRRDILTDIQERKRVLP
jgi:uncharacterized protein